MFSVLCIWAVGWCLCGIVECHLDCAWHRQRFPGFDWTPEWRDWQLYALGPVCLICGAFYRHVNGRR